MTSPIRATLVERIRRQLERSGSPRLQMTLIVMVTAVAGFLFSALLLSLGIDVMWQRYPIGAAYVVFLLLLWLWMRTPEGQEGSRLGLLRLARSGHRSGIRSRSRVRPAVSAHGARTT